MRLISLAVLSVLMGGSIGCSGKNNTTSAPSTPATPGDLQPTRTAPSGDSPTGGLPTNTTPVDSKSKLRVEIANGRVTVNGKPLEVPTDLAGLKKVFGKSSGSSTDPNIKDERRFYWRDLGIVATQETKGKQEFVEIEFGFRAIFDQSTNSPGKPFSGEIILEGQPGTPTTSPAELGKKISILGKEKYDWWHIHYKEPPLHVIMAARDPGVEFVSLKPGKAD